MAVTKVRRDRHGPYVVTNGSYHRPVLSDGYNHAPGCVLGATAFAVGSQVKVSALSGSPLCRVWDEAREEHWQAHGQTGEFIDGQLKKLPSEDAWKPAHQRWERSLGGTPVATAKSDGDRAATLRAIGIAEASPIQRAN